ncbi:MAG: cytochrome ubiquinol oxidase subunit I [Proteobacteria bacterium]|nr:cytochrome ubiquinol oxidase subunit I [Pseudomonadota bacterium]
MDLVTLSRLQFATATLFHFLFVPLTIGLGLLIAVMETRYARTGDEMWRRMARFWAKIFLINFVLGVVTGITLEFQFGTNWARYSAFVGDVFGPLLAIEALAAFFLESTLVGVWAFSWSRVSAKTHAVLAWLVAVASALSALWILAANAWMQHPVGYVIRNGRAELTDLWAIVFQKFSVLMFFHTVMAAFILGAFFVMGVSAWHLLKKQHVEFFTKSFRMALVLGMVVSVAEFVEGHVHGADLAEKQPAKLAAMDALWETEARAPIYLFSWPDQENQRNAIQIGRLPGMLSLLAHHDINAEVMGLKQFPPEDQPPVAVVNLAFKGMVGLGSLFILLTAVGWWKRNRLVESPWYLKAMILAMPLPYLAISLGWILAEMGRQPWVVYGIMRTSEAHSEIASGQVAATLAVFILLYGILGALAFSLMARAAGKGPETPEDETIA